MQWWTVPAHEELYVGLGICDARKVEGLGRSIMVS